MLLKQNNLTFFSPEQQRLHSLTHLREMFQGCHTGKVDCLGMMEDINGVNRAEWDGKEKESSESDSRKKRGRHNVETESHESWCGVEESVMVGWDLSPLTSLVPPQTGVCRLCLIKQLNVA